MGKAQKKLKVIPSFKTEEEEMDFWDSANTSEYFGNGKIMSWKEIKAMIKKHSENNNQKD